MHTHDAVGCPLRGWHDAFSKASIGERKPEMNRAELVLALDEWMRKLIETPDEFDEQLHRVTQTLKGEGKMPSYGLAGVAILEMCLDDARQRMN